MSTRFFRLGFAACLTITAVFPSAISAQTPSQSRDSKLMADAEYRAFLAQVDAFLPKWEESLQNIDPEKDERISYSLGKSIVTERDIALMEVGNIHSYITAQRLKRTVSGELALAGFLDQPLRRHGR